MNRLRLGRGGERCELFHPGAILRLFDSWVHHCHSLSLSHCPLQIHFLVSDRRPQASSLQARSNLSSPYLNSVAIHQSPFYDCANSQNAFHCRADVSRAFGTSTYDHLPIRGFFASCFLTSYQPISILGPTSSLYGTDSWIGYLGLS